MVMDVPAAFLFADSACSEAEHVSQTHTHRDDTDMAGYPDPHLLQWLTPQARGVYIPALTLVLPQYPVTPVTPVAGRIDGEITQRDSQERI